MKLIKIILKWVKKVKIIQNKFHAKLRKVYKKHFSKRKLNLSLLLRSFLREINGLKTSTHSLMKTYSLFCKTRWNNFKKLIWHHYATWEWMTMKFINRHLFVILINKVKISWKIWPVLFVSASWSCQLCNVQSLIATEFCVESALIKWGERNALTLDATSQSRIKTPFLEFCEVS